MSDGYSLGDGFNSKSSLEPIDEDTRTPTDEQVEPITTSLEFIWEFKPVEIELSAEFFWRILYGDNLS